MTSHEMTIQIARAEGVMMALYGFVRDMVIGCSVDADKDGKLGDGDVRYHEWADASIQRTGAEGD